MNFCFSQCPPPVGPAQGRPLEKMAQAKRLQCPHTYHDQAPLSQPSPSLLLMHPCMAGCQGDVVIVRGVWGVELQEAETQQWALASVECSLIRNHNACLSFNLRKYRSHGYSSYRLCSQAVYRAWHRKWALKFSLPHVYTYVMAQSNAALPPSPPPFLSPCTHK